MMNMKSKRVWRILTGILPAIALVVSSTASAKTPTKRVPPEVAVGGLTSVEQAANKVALRTELQAKTPAGVLAQPITVELTQTDREEIAAPNIGPAPLKIGKVLDINPRVTVMNGNGMNRGVTQEEKDGSFVWALAITSPGAQAIRVNLSSFSLGADTKMYVYGPDGIADGPYTATGRNGTGQFWTRSISGDTTVIQLHYTGANRNEISFVISEIAHISGRLIDGGPVAEPRTHDSWPCSDNASCLIDATCGNRGPAEAAKDAVAKLEWIQGPFVNTCSGGLLADTDSGSQIPYVLTANHCTSSSISNLETWFNYTTASCNGVCPHNAITGGAPPSDTIGFTVVASSSSSDFTLGTLDQAAPAGAVFLGWNNTPVAFNDGDPLYRISNANFGPQVYSQADVDTDTPTCTGINRGDFIYSNGQTGGTMGGSSGSPVVNGSGEVVGQLFGCCGFDCADECANAPTNWTVDGAFAATWSSVEQFLDPQPSACNNNGTCEAGEDCNNCSNDCISKTNGNPNSHYCCGDGTCEGAEDSSNCAIDCGGGGCTNNGECDDGDACNGAETCVGGSCQAGTAPPCQNGDGCCPSGCTPANDDDCSSCGGQNAPCTQNGDCCSGNCRNNGKCSKP